MRQVVLYIAASLDNFIARPDGNIDWLHYDEYEVEGEDYGYHEFYDSIDTTLMGNKTYRVTLGFNMPFPYPDKTNYVFTRSENMKDNDDVQFVNEDIIAFTRQLKNEAGKDIWLVGGGQINSLFFRHDLIDKIVLTIIPIVLGAGIPLFDGPSRETKFKLKSTKPFDSGLVQLVYQKDH